jgi:uncharacterized protein (AIM24 family)
MASTITAGNATNGLALSCDNTGILELKTGTGSGTTAVTIDASQNVTLATGIAGDFKMNSGYGSVATAYGCRAWVNFNGTGTVAIRGSGNVTSITDNGTGDYTVNFTAAMPDANYSLVYQFEAANSAFSASGRSSTIVTLAAGSCRLRTGFLNSTAVFTAEDEPTICGSIFR